MTSFKSRLLCAASAVFAVGAWAQAPSASAQTAPAGAADAPAASTVASVIVTAPRQASTARLQQYNAINLVNSQSAETIAQYPDFNAAEALGRIPGVSLSSDTGEGRFVNIRGIDANLNGATYGGVVLLNTYAAGTVFGSGRAVEFDTVPIGAVDRIEVTKTGLPDHEAEGLGGSVELTPRSAMNISKPFLDITAGGGYEPLRGTSLVREEVVLGARFGLTPHGIIVGGDDAGPAGTGWITNPTPFSFVFTQFLLNDRRGVDDIEAAYADQPGVFPDKTFDTLELRRYQYHRRRTGYSGEFDFKPNDNHSYYFRTSIAGYTEGVKFRQRLLYSNLEFDANGAPLTAAQYTDPSNANGFLAPAASLTSTLRDQQETHTNSVFAVGGIDHFGEVTLDYRASYSEAIYHKPYDYNSTFAGPTAAVAYDNITNPDMPKIRVTDGTNIFDPTAYKFSNIQNSSENDNDNEWAYAANLSFPLHLLANDHLKFGGEARLRNKYERTANQILDASQSGLTLANFLGAGPFTFYNNGYNVGYSASGIDLQKYYSANLASVTENVSRDASNYFNDTENVYAGYVQYEGSYGPWSGLVGVRVEDTQAIYRGFTQTTDVNGVKTITPAAVKSSYTNPFPTAQLRYAFSPKLIARATYSTAIGRPGFVQTIQSSQVDVGQGTVATGNPSLKPTFGNNFDLSLEYYLPHAGIASIGAFDKEFDNYIVQRTFQGTYPGIVGIARISSYQNVPSAHARGIEADYTQKLSWLPWVFSGLGIEANVTYVDSDVALRSGGHHLLPATSRWTGNGALFYEGYGIQSRLATQYVSKSLFSIGGSDATDIIQDDRLTLDFTAEYAATHNVGVYFNAKNLLNTPLRYYEGAPNRPIQREFYDVTLEAGVKVHL